MRPVRLRPTATPASTLSGLLLAGLLPILLPGPVAGQAASGSWRLGAGAGSAWITAGHPYMRTGQQAPVLRLDVQRVVARRFAIGVQWIGTWYVGDYGDERRHTLAVTGSVYPVGGLFLTAGVGPGIASLVVKEGPPSDGPGDVLIDVFEGESAFSATGDIGWEIPLHERIAIAPALSGVTHWLHGDRMTFLALTARLAVRLP